jgi:hypothetical protein
LQALKAIKKKPSVSVSGPEMFGYASPVIQLLFQELPDAEYGLFLAPVGTNAFD